MYADLDTEIEINDGKNIIKNYYMDIIYIEGTSFVKILVNPKKWPSLSKGLFVMEHRVPF
jgi:hypothetical protein